MNSSKFEWSQIAGVGIILLVGVGVFWSGCNPVLTPTLPERPVPGTGSPLPGDQKALSIVTDRARLVKDSDRQGGTILTAQSTSCSTFTWSAVVLQTPDGLTPLSELAADRARRVSDLLSFADAADLVSGFETGIARNSQITITGVISDPGASGTFVRFTVTPTVFSGDANAPCDASASGDGTVGEPRDIVLQIVRAQGPLSVSLTSLTGIEVEPGGQAQLQALITGGTPFDVQTLTPSCTDDGCETVEGERLSDSSVRLREGQLYDVTWEVIRNNDPSGDVDWLSLCQPCVDTVGSASAQAIYSAPPDQVDVALFRVTVRDSEGGIATSMLPVSIKPAGELRVNLARAFGTAVQPGTTAGLTASAVGGRSPYTLTFSVDPKTLGGAVSKNEDGSDKGAQAGCAGLVSGQPCEAFYHAADDREGSDSVTVTVTDGVGDTATAVIPLIITAERVLTVTGTSTKARINPGDSAEIEATITGGTPPYAVCFETESNDAQGTLGKGKKDCEGPGTNCSCGSPDAGSDDFVVSRTYRAKVREGSETIRINVRDNVGREASTVVPLLIQSANTLTAAAVPESTTVLPGDSTNINVTVIGGTTAYNVTITDEGPLQGGTLETTQQSGNGPEFKFKYTAPPLTEGDVRFRIDIEDAVGDKATAFASIIVGKTELAVNASSDPAGFACVLGNGDGNGGGDGDGDCEDCDRDANTVQFDAVADGGISDPNDGSYDYLWTVFPDPDGDLSDDDNFDDPTLKDPVWIVPEVTEPTLYIFTVQATDSSDPPLEAFDTLVIVVLPEFSGDLTATPSRVIAGKDVALDIVGLNGGLPPYEPIEWIVTDPNENPVDVFDDNGQAKFTTLEDVLGNYTITATVRDATGLSESCNLGEFGPIMVEAFSALEVQVVQPPNSQCIPSGADVRIGALIFGGIGDRALEWTVNPPAGQFDDPGNSRTLWTAPIVDRITEYALIMTATDEEGNQAADFVTIAVHPPILASVEVIPDTLQLDEQGPIEPATVIISIQDGDAAQFYLEFIGASDGTGLLYGSELVLTPSSDNRGDASGNNELLGSVEIVPDPDEGNILDIQEPVVLFFQAKLSEACAPMDEDSVRSFPFSIRVLPLEGK